MTSLQRQDQDDPYDERSGLLQAATSPSSWGAIAGADLANAEAPENGRQPPDTEDQDRIKGTRLYVTLLSVWGTNLVFALSTTAVATLAPQISSHFEHIELGSYIGSCFSFASTVTTPLFGALTDHMSRPAVMVLAGVIYAIGTLGCALSDSMWTLLAARAVTGAGGAGILTLSSIITTDLISLRERGYYQGLMMVIFGLGAAAGGPVAGFLSDRYGWQTAFLAQIPLLVLSLISLYILLPRPPHTIVQSKSHTLIHTLDLPGTALLTLAVGSLLLGLSFHTSGWHWTSLRVWGLMVIAVASSFGFAFVERLSELRGNKVLVPWAVLGQRNVFFGTLSAFFMSLANGSVIYNIPLYFSIVRSASSTAAGLHLLPNSIGVSLGSLLSGQIIRSTGHYRVLGLLSLVLPIVGAVLMTGWNDETSRAMEWLDVVPAGLGYSSYLVTSLIALISSVPKEQIPKATAISYLFRTLGGTLGVAFCAALQQAVLARELASRITGEGSAQIIANITHSKSYVLTLPPALRAQAVEAYALSLRATFIVTAGMGVLALIAAWPVEEHHLGEKDGPVGGGKSRPSSSYEPLPSEEP